MMYFRIECKLLAMETVITEKADEKETAANIAALSEVACASLMGKLSFVVYQIKNDVCLIAVVAQMDLVIKQPIRDFCQKFLSSIKINGSPIKIEEITECEYLKMLRCAKNTGYVDNIRELRDSFSLLNDNNKHQFFNFKEAIIKNIYNHNDAMKKANQIVCGQSMSSELERIFAKNSVCKFSGHPVHYYITCRDLDKRNKMVEILLGSLYKANRIISRRYAIISNDIDFEISSDELRRLYKSLAGGTIVIHCKDDENDSEYANISEEKFELIGKLMNKYSQTVLTIICSDIDNGNLKIKLMDQLIGSTFVEINDEIIITDDAKKYLKRLAKDNEITDYKGLLAMLPPNETGYFTSDLNTIFEKWHGNYLRNTVFSQYSSIVSNKQVNLKPKGDAYKELSGMIGIADAKQMINNAIDYYKAQKLFKRNNALCERPSMHMVFTGNPGTAKTTVARLFAQIMKDNDLLRIGNLFEVGRSDLVGKYVGWTANIVKEKFKRANGSVLFIDEAYSLVEEKGGMYGDEAINTIVQEMENMRDDIVVIFAGYSEKMSEFLAHNNGLQSRVAFHVNFPDYTVDELVLITSSMAKNRKLHLECGVEEKLALIYNESIKQPDFGNGRFARNILEKAMMRQASRLVTMEYDTVTERIAATLIPEDFEIPKVTGERKKRFGFRY
ncbi:MAG: AAA family ATPase [Saccharofermentanales bacterium]